MRATPTARNFTFEADVTQALLTCGYEVTVEIGGLPVLVRTCDAEFRAMLEDRYAGFVVAEHREAIEFDVELVSPHRMSGEEDVRVCREAGRWIIRRGDFRAEYDPASGRGTLCCSANPYALDSVLRIVHTLRLAGEGGFLVHAASAICKGRGLLFAGVSGAGKTTMCRLAPPEVTLLSDEVSCVRRQSDGYGLFGTPFRGELARNGENAAAPLAAVFLLGHGPENRLVPLPAAEAGRALLRNILFFAEDAELAEKVFHSVCEFVTHVPVFRLEFTPSPRVWEMLP
jgi:hypothetical protein